ncbi:MAG: recombinase RecT, partial [Hyphomicrobiaceae bacterium]|nr:recombinase RecT [Hyphomicrobiaceae bacterium]
MSPIVRDANEAALAGFEAIGVATPEQINLIFRTVAKECKNQDERNLYLMTCKASGLSPLKKQLYATRRKGELVFVTAYGVFVSRARRAGFVIHGECVCEEDQWMGWDAVNLAPIGHVIQKE